MISVCISESGSSLYVFESFLISGTFIHKNRSPSPYSPFPHLKNLEVPIARTGSANVLRSERRDWSCVIAKSRTNEDAMPSI